MLKIIHIRAQCGMTGFESPATEYMDSSLDLSTLLIQHPEATYLCFAEGDSMTGDGIYSGDLLIVSKEVKINDHDIIVATLNGGFICKKIDIKRQQLLSSGVGFATYQLKDDEELKVDGVVISSIRMHREFTKVI